VRHRNCSSNEHPSVQADGGWYFDLSTDPNSVHYVLATLNMAASSYFVASILVTTTETLVLVHSSLDSDCFSMFNHERNILWMLCKRMNYSWLS
jgi:hypothetical protein